MSKLQAALSRYSEFERALSSILGILHFEERVREYEIDHIALQAATNKDGEEVVEELLAQNTSKKNPLSDAIVNGRRVLLFELGYPLLLFGQNIVYLEVLFPKKEAVFTQTALDHIEIVIPFSQVIGTFEDALVAILGEQYFKQAKNKLAYKVSSPIVDGVLDLNVLSANFSNNENIAIKFHPIALNKIVETEKKEIFRNSSLSGASS